MIRIFMTGLFLLVPVAAAVGGCSDRDTVAPDATPPVAFAAQSALGHPSGTEALMQQVIRDRWVELLNTGDLAIADEIYAADLLPHIPHHPHVTDLASYKQVTVAATHQLIADFHAAVHDLFAHGDKVVGRFTATGLMGGVVPYTNTWIIAFRFEDGTIVEEWWQFDLLGVQQQLGAIPGSRATYTWGEPSTVTGDPGHPPKNQGLVRRAEQVWETGNTVQADHVFSADFVNHDPVVPSATDRESFKESVRACLEAFPDFETEIQDVVAAGDRVAVRRTVTATHDGPFAGIPATGRQVEWTGMTIYRIADGRIVEAWWSYDALGLMLQLTGTM